MRVPRPFDPEEVDRPQDKEYKKHVEWEEKPLATEDKRQSEDFHGGDESTESLPDSPNEGSEERQEDQQKSGGSSASNSQQSQSSKGEQSQRSDGNQSSTGGSSQNQDSSDKQSSENSSHGERQESQDSSEGQSQQSNNNESSASDTSETSDGQNSGDGNQGESQQSSGTTEGNNVSQSSSETQQSEQPSQSSDSKESADSEQVESEPTSQGANGENGETSDSSRDLSEESDLNNEMGDSNERNDEKFNSEEEGQEKASDSNEESEAQVNSGTYNTNQVFTYTETKNNMKLSRALYDFIEYIADETKVYNNLTADYYEPKKLMLRRYQGKSLNAAKSGKVRETIVVLLDNSGSMDWVREHVLETARALIQRHDAEIYFAPNGQVECQITKQGEVPVVHGNVINKIMSQQLKVLYIGDFDGAETPIELSWKTKVFWLCPESRYRRFQSHRWISYDESAFRGFFARTYDAREMVQALKRFSGFAQFSRCWYDPHEREVFQDD